MYGTVLGIGILAAIVGGIFIIWYVWLNRKGGNLDHPLIATQYLIETYFYQRRNRKRQYHQRTVKILAAPDTVSPLSAQEDAFFFLHEIELDTKIELSVNAQQQVEVTKRQFKQLVDYFHFTSKPCTPHEAFGHYGLSLALIAPAKKNRSPQRLSADK